MRASNGWYMASNAQNSSPDIAGYWKENEFIRITVFNKWKQEKSALVYPFSALEKESFPVVV